MNDRPAPFQHQVEIARYLFHRDYFAVLAEMGTGKSRPLLRAWRGRHDRSMKAGTGPVDLLLIAPKGTYLNWLTFPPPKGCDPEPGELEKWLTPEEYANTEMAHWKAPSSQTKGDKNRLAALLRAERPRFFTMNIDALNIAGPGRDYVLKFIAKRNVMIAIDESTVIAHYDAARTNWILYKLRPFVRWRYILTGLVAPESPMNMWAQYFWLDPDILGHSWFGFQQKYAITEMVNFTPVRNRTLEKPGRLTSHIVGWRTDAYEDINQRIAPHSYRVLLDDVVDLPPRTYSYWDVELTPEQEQAYSEMKRIARVVLDDATYVTASMAAHQLALLHHILCGHARAESGAIADIPSNRVKALLEIINDSIGSPEDVRGDPVGHPKKAIVFAPYPRTIKKISAALAQAYGEDSVVEYMGATTLPERAEARTRIQQDPDCRFIVSNQSVGGKGGTWTAATLQIFFANSWDQEDRQHAEYRAHRLGQTKSVHIIDMRVPGTIEQRMIALLKSKRLTNAELMGDRYREWLE
jgi:hypothetical protein